MKNSYDLCAKVRGGGEGGINEIMDPQGHE
jgi:hypothetical protein